MSQERVVFAGLNISIAVGAGASSPLFWNDIDTPGPTSYQVPQGYDLILSSVVFTLPFGTLGWLEFFINSERMLTLPAPTSAMFLWPAFVAHEGNTVQVKIHNRSAAGISTGALGVWGLLVPKGAYNPDPAAFPPVVQRR